jgi:hypothetical protein
MKTTLILLVLLLCFGIFQPVEIYAAPFCAVFSSGKQCYYYTWDECQRAAGSRGACVINDEEVKAPSSNGAPFCVVTSYGTNCWYYDAASCRQAAASSGGVCAVNPNR